MGVRQLINWASAGLRFQSETHEHHEYDDTVDNDPSSTDNGSPDEYLTPPLDFDLYECAREMYGSCPLDDISLEELNGMGDSWIVYYEYERDYCVQLAAHLVATDGAEDRLHPVTETDGRHRRCIAEKLQDVGITVHLREAKI